EMETEPPAAAYTPEQEAEPASPLRHETAIANPAENAVEDGIEPVHQHFAPGAGELEEEILEEDEYPATLQASSVEELDEEETLEGAADLGTMIREMSIDEITGSGTGEGPNAADLDEDGDEEIEEDDLEEEDSFDDGTHEYEEDLEESDGEDESEDEEIHEEGGESAEEGESASANGFDRSQAAAPCFEPRRDGGRDRRDGRRDGRRGDRGRSDRPRYTGGSGDRERSGSGGRDRRGGRNSMQTTNLPAISELLKPGQEVLVQIAKEPIAKKGARITSHIALPGRFLVFMPTVNHTGVSRKIESDAERRRLKEILLSEKGEASGGFIVRTAASGASEEELRSDLRFLLNLWADIKQRSESSKSPALIYHDLNLVERILRDQVTDNFSAIWVDTETEYERVLRFLQRFQPSLIRRVKLYTKETPLFEQFGITEEINKALRSKVWLKSGGSIVINQTEALVAIDINTGKYVGKTARLEDTIVKTNLDAIPEIVRQIRLRDLGGIIIIDFIDMDERKNRNRVMAALEEELKNDRAPSKVLQFNDFGLVAITRKRVKQSLERTLSTTCGVCQGTGMTKSPVTVCNDIYVEMRKMQKHLDRGDVMLRVHPDVVKQLKSSTKWLQELEEMVGKTILVKSDPSLHPEQFDIH
ncbi:MAG: Rne/Rng family ribonuclease, partial [Acidobacteriales bacterium]|nr:Rne/Rng family ribonuclease [Terriglobales bacterium]